MGYLSLYFTMKPYFIHSLYEISISKFSLMNIQKHTVVALTYELKLNDAAGEFIEKTTEEEPLVFLAGIGMMLPKFEANVDGLKAGDKFAFGLSSADSYGEREENAIVSLPRSIFAEAEDLLKLGGVIPMRNQEGQMMQGKVLAITVQEVKMDFNHAMAGKNLYFAGKIQSVRAATQEEIDHGHVHGPGGHNH